MKKTTNLLFACVGLVALSITGCSRQDRTQDQPGTQATPATQELGQQTTETGQADVSREVVKRETETMEESIPTVMKGTEKADINRMDTDDFVALGLPEDSAKKITDYREKNGDFASVDALSQVPGIDSAWLQTHRSHLSAGTQAAGEAESGSQE